MSGRFQVSGRVGRIITLLSLVFFLFVASAIFPFLAGKGIIFAIPSSPTETLSAGTLYLNTTFNVENHCFYSVNQIFYALNMVILANGTQIYAYSTHLAAVLPGQIERYSISIPITASSLPSWFLAEAYTRPVNMSLSTSVSASYAVGFFHFGINFARPFISSSIVKPAAAANGHQAPVNEVSMHSLRSFQISVSAQSKYGAVKRL
jgi:hypothetical protein